ncbi:DM13 domain-containing protein [bacterium]|nr:DM13 domain-containing protein [bacterium]
MKKKYLIFLGGLAVFAGLVYFTGLYTYFVRHDVQEPLPATSRAPGLSPVPARTPVTVAQGEFGEVDFIHKGSGTARIIEDGGRRYLRLENFSVVSGPDLFVYLSESKTPTSDIKSLDKYISLGRLKGTSGNQNYEIPEPFRGYDTAVIWCQRYGVLFTYAVMR